MAMDSARHDFYARARLDEAMVAGWGRRIGLEAEPPLFVTLRGRLGAGKSVLARAVARGAGVEGPVPSPTFNLLFRYPGSRGRDVVHLDLYRLSAPSELDEIGWTELGAAHELVLVEWPERAGALLPADRWDVSLEPVPGAPGLRDVRVTRLGDPGPLPLLPDGPRAPAP
jgi:tRNA threonylcarbamoyl adenosine modification protein YjeE